MEWHTYFGHLIGGDVITSFNIGEQMTKITRKHFPPAFRLEAAQLVVDQNYSIREAADSMNVGKSSMDKWVRQLRLERESKPGGGSPIAPDQLRIKELEKRLKRVEEEKEILKQATALLMSGSLNGLR